MAQRTQINKIIELGVAHRQMNDHILQDAVVALAQERARARVSAAAPVALTDSSTGTAAGTPFNLVAVVTPVTGVVDGVTTFSPKAGFDTATTAIEAAHKELSAKVNEFLVLIASASGPQITMTAGGAANNTLEAITPLLTAAATACLEDATGKLEITKARNVQSALASAINFCRVAMGLGTMADGSGGIFDRAFTGWNMDSNARAATAAGQSTNGQITLTDASVDAALTALTNNIATMGAALNQMRGTLAIGPFVIATSNPRGRLRQADVTV